MTLRTDDWRGLMSELAIDRRLSELSDSTPDMAEKTILGTMRSRITDALDWVEIGEKVSIRIGGAGDA